MEQAIKRDAINLAFRLTKKLPHVDVNVHTGEELAVSRC